MFLAQPLRLQRLRLAGRFEPGRVGVEADRFESECIASAPIIVLLVSARCLADRATAIQQAVVVPDHLIAVTIAQDQDSLSCLEPTVIIQGVAVQPDQSVQYHWSAVTANGNDPDFSTAGAPVVSVPGTYTVLVTEPQSGCTAQASVGIAGNSAPSVDLGTIVLPNVISPNGDGKNDVWRPYALSAPELDITGLFDEYTFFIYNRWGQRVDNGATGNQRWWDARDVPAGTYFYTVAYRAECGFKVDEERQGVVTVLK